MFNIDPGGDALTAQQFSSLSAYEKGFTVYMCGSCKDQPNVPEEYKPAAEDREEYKAGQHTAITAVVDVEG